jgi:hypothetical protein
MEAFLGTTGQHLTSFLNLMLMKRMDTGDRMLDTTLQMLLSTLIGGLITGLVTVYSKGMWGEVRNRARCLWSSAEYDPLKFDPRLAPEKPANGSTFVYKAYWHPANWATFLSWFFTYHENKQFSQKLEKSIHIPTPTSNSRRGDDESDMKMAEFNLLDTSIIRGSAAVRRFNIPSSTFIPIWRSKTGFYVYMNTNGDDIDDEGVMLYSDSAEAVRECLAHIATHHGQMNEYTEQLKKKGLTGRGHEIVEFLANGDYFTRGNTINAKKTFDTLFFAQKGETMRMLEAFKEERLFAPHMPIDNKLGFLLYGPPGTGKTGFIAAVSNYLGRDVVYVDTSRIKTRKAFDAVLEMDVKKYIFIFEEFDTMPGVGRRDVGGEGGGGSGGSGAATPGKGNGTGMGAGAEGPDMAQMAMMLMAGQKKEGGGGDLMDELREERKTAADRLDLGYLLRKLDGLESGEGRIIIATTNHPERIDPALLRPGRFGFQLHLTRCTGQMLVEMVRMIYQATDMGDPDEAEKRWEAVLERLKGVPDLKWAPAEVLQLGVMLATPEEMVAHLLEKEPACFR